jgi:hypothetical protein
MDSDMENRTKRILSCNDRQYSVCETYLDMSLLFIFSLISILALYRHIT